MTEERKIGLVMNYELLAEENKKLRDRLQFDPGGSDKIDELEQCIQFLRHDIKTLTAANKHMADKLTRIMMLPHSDEIRDIVLEQLKEEDQ